MERSTNTSKTESSTSTLSNYKDEEKQLSESLFRNLHVMQRFHEPTPEFLQIFEPHMFVKSNAKAFFPVMHFIFTCLDPTEFNKRFQWPLLEKTSEARFRTNCIDYMNHLNDIHQLGLHTLKLSNIHIPGGLKFIKIIHRFSYLIMKVEVNKPKYGPLPNMHEIPDGNDMFEKFEVYVEQGMEYVAELEMESEKLHKRIEEMKALMKSCLKTTSETNDCCWKCLQKEWRDELDLVVQTDVAPKLKDVTLFSQQTVNLNKMLTKLLVDKKENVVRYDKDKLEEAQQVLKKMYPEKEQEISGIVEGNFINFDNLFKVFSRMLPDIMNKLESFSFRDVESVEFESEGIEQLYKIVEKKNDLLSEYREMILPMLQKDEERFRKFCESYNKQQVKPPFCLMQTPPVKRKSSAKSRNLLSLKDDLLNQSKLLKEPSVCTSSSSTSSQRTFSCTSSSNYKSKEAALQVLARPKSRLNSTRSSSNMTTMSRFTSTPKFSSTMCTTVTTNGMNHQPRLKFDPLYPMTPTHVYSENISRTTSMLSPQGIAVLRTEVAKSSVFHSNQQYLVSPTRRFRIEIPPEIAAIMQTNGSLATFENGSEGQIENRQQDENKQKPNGNEIADEFIGDVSDTVLNVVNE